MKTRLAAGEQEATAWGFRDLIQRGGLDVVQPDLTRCGGFTQARKIAWEAEYAGVDVCPHAWLTDLLTAASLHFNAVLPRVALPRIQRLRQPDAPRDHPESGAAGAGRIHCGAVKARAGIEVDEDGGAPFLREQL